MNKGVGKGHSLGLREFLSTDFQTASGTEKATIRIEWGIRFPASVLGVEVYSWKTVDKEVWSGVWKLSPRARRPQRVPRWTSNTRNLPQDTCVVVLGDALVHTEPQKGHLSFTFSPASRVAEPIHTVESLTWEQASCSLIRLWRHRPQSTNDVW